MLIGLSAVWAGSARAAQAPGEERAQPSAPIPQQRDMTPVPDRPQGTGTTLTLTPYASHAFDADLDNDADVSVSRGGADLTIAHPLTERLITTVGLRGEYSRYEFDNLLDLVSDELGDAADNLGFDDDRGLDMILVSISPGVIYRLNDRWSAIGGISVAASGESDADFGDSLTFGGYVGARYKVNDRLAVALGVAARSRLEDDALVVPLIPECIEGQSEEQWKRAGREYPHRP